MRSSAKPIVIAEDDYASGAILFSGADRRSALSVRRTRITASNPEVALGWGYKPGQVVRLYLKTHPNCSFSHGNRRITVPPRYTGEASFRETSEPCLWPVMFPIDQLRFEFPETALARWLEDHRQAQRFRLDLKSGTTVLDNTLIAFGRAALASLEKPETASQFFVDHILTGVCSYLLDNFSSSTKTLATGGLAPWQERRAKELIELRLGSGPSLDELAHECGLSVAHFTRAFRQSTGETPHKWLMRRRVAAAERLLLSSERSLAQIAFECGFADQCHFTNIFARMVGTPPGVYRREQNTSKKSN